jgi:cation:H+ antiporter
MAIWVLILLAAGLTLLWKGADFMSEGAVGLAERMGVSKLIIGLTIVAMGTSAPEVAAGIVAALDGKGDIILGNVFGANVANLALIAGLVALIRPLQVRAGTARREIPAMLGVALLLWPVLHNLTVSRIEGILLAAVFAGLLLYTVRRARGSAAREIVPELHLVVKPAHTTGRNVLLMVLGLAALTVGARLAVYAAATIGGRLDHSGDRDHAAGTDDVRGGRHERAP